MSNDLSNYRKTYGKRQLNLEDMNNDPFTQFDSWFKEVDTKDYKFEANAMTLSTIGIDGFPRNRVVLLKEYDHNGFIFYSNYNSQKGQAIKNINKVCISFFWQQQERQIIIKGKVEKLPEDKSTAYFHSRPKGSQLGAAVSQQSQPIQDRAVLEERLAKLQKEYANSKVPKPKDWGGYIVKPMEFEFWQGRDNRLHDRILYTEAEKSGWILQRLQP